MLGAWWAAAHSVADEVALVASEHNALQWPGPSREPELAAALLRVDAFSAHGPAVTETVLRLGLPPSRLVPGRSSIEWPLAGPAIDLPGSRIVFAGRLHREKGPDLLLEAMARLADPPLCVMLGSGPERANLEGQARALGIERHVLMPGWHRQVAPWLLGAKAAVVASRHEAWSQAAVTAMAAGVPVIGASVEGLPQTLGEGRGILVPPQDPAALADAIARVLGGERPDLEAARAYALRFTPERVAAYYERIYSDAIARRREERAAATERRAA